METQAKGVLKRSPGQILTVRGSNLDNLEVYHIFVKIVAGNALENSLCSKKNVILECRLSIVT